MRGGYSVVKAAACLLLPALLAACGGPPRTSPESGGREAASEDRIRVEAYSFNSRLWRGDKPTTFKLEVYQTDSLLGLAGKGYLGKGALKGRLTADSLEVYFPSTKEYLYEPLEELLATGECPLPLADMNILSLFSNLPDSIALDPSLRIRADYGNPDRPEFDLSKTGCPWRIHVVYDLKAPGWRIREFDINDGKQTRLRGRLDKYKEATSVKANRLSVLPPAGAVRISP